MRLIADGPGARAAVSRAHAEILGYHARLTRFDPASELCTLNADPRPVVPARRRCCARRSGPGCGRRAAAAASSTRAC